MISGLYHAPLEECYRVDKITTKALTKSNIKNSYKLKFKYNYEKYVIYLLLALKNVTSPLKIIAKNSFCFYRRIMHISLYKKFLDYILGKKVSQKHQKDFFLK